MILDGWLLFYFFIYYIFLLVAHFYAIGQHSEMLLGKQLSKEAALGLVLILFLNRD